MATITQPEVPKEKAVLDPDNPLLAGFQKALKEYYVNQINRLNNEIFEYETEAAKKNADREQLGIQTYEVQQMVCSQQKVLEGIVHDLQTTTAAREETESILREGKAKHKETQQELITAEKTELDLRNEVNAVNLLVNQMSEWENRIESNIQVNQRIAEKTRKDYVKLIEEKRSQDAVIYKVMKEIWKLESEVETMNVQLKVKEAEREELTQTAALGNTNLEALQAEYRCLMHSWNSVVVAISNRDKVLGCIHTEVNKIREKVKSVISEIEQIKKLTKKEMQENERYMMNKSRIEYDIKNCKTSMDEEMAKFNAMDKTMTELQGIIDQTERDIQRAEAENHQKELDLTLIGKDYDKVTNKKFALEKRLLEEIENQLASDTAAENLHRLLRNVREKKKDMEIKMNESQNKLSLTETEFQSQRYNNEHNEKLLKDLLKQRTDLEKEADNYEAEKEKLEMLFRKKERHVTVLNNKLEKLTEKTTGQVLVSPQELKMITLEKQIEETKEKIKNLQSYWLREQRNLLNVSKERQEQIHNVNLLKKQVLILEQKNLKVNDEIEAFKKQDEKIQHNINSLQNKATVLCDTLFKKRGHTSNLDKTNYYLQTQYDSKLKDAELECLKIQADISEIEEDKVSLSNKLLELNREALEWEKKIQLARDTKENLRQEWSQSGEVGNMKQEIHKMNVIYGQLKRAQDKLVKDLEHCVLRRESMFTGAEARGKRSKAGEDKTRINYTRKMDDIKNKIKQQENETKKTVKAIRELTEEIQKNQYYCRKLEADINFSLDYMKNIKQDIEKSKTSRQLKFEMLLSLQKKLSVLNDLAADRHPYVVFKKEDVLVAEYSKQKDLNDRLSKTVNKLLTDFPNHKHRLTRIYNTLKLHVYIMGTDLS